MTSRSKRPVEAAEQFHGAEDVRPLERAVLGNAMSDREVMDAIAEHFHRGDFTSLAHQTIWDEMVVLHRERALSPEALTTALAARGALVGLVREFSDVGNMTGEAYVRFLASHKSGNPDHWIDQLEREITRREGSVVAQLLYTELTSGHDDPYTLLEEGMRRMEQARRVRTTGGASIGDILGEFEARVTSQLSGTFTPGYRFTALCFVLDPFIPFLEAEDYMILATRPGQGKSSIARAEMGDSAIAGTGTYIINMENSPIQYAMYLLARMTGINSRKLKDATLLSSDELDVVRNATRQLKNIPLRIVTMSSPTAQQVADEIRGLNKAGYTAGAVDYLQLIRNGINDPVQDITVTSHTIRGVAMKTKHPILGIAQLSRAIEQRGDDNPKLSDLRGSGDLENDATQVVFPWSVWRNPADDEISALPENFRYRETGEVRAMPIQLHIGKNRNDALGTTRAFIWDKATNRFRPIE